jgi:hypothetical protein
MNFKVELLIRKLFAISLKVEDGNIVIKCLGFSITFSCDTLNFCCCGCILSLIPYKSRDRFLPHCVMEMVFMF